MGDDRLKPGGVLEGRLFEGFLRRLSETREPEPGDRIGAWRIVCELGRGGSGVVYMAERADGAFSQQVALKWLRGDRPVLGGREALARERELLASLDHPHIARLIDGGQTDDGMLWFAMDLAEGEIIDRHAVGLELHERLVLVAKLCRAVHYAHRRGLIHGDIKPSNVLVDGRGEPRLVDFGISRMKGGGLGSSYGLTPDYASPEQRAGDPLTTASDIWQLGHLLDDLVGDEVAAADLRSIIDRATAESTDCRYASASAMAADIDDWLGDRPVLAHGGGLVYSLSCWVRRNRSLSLVSATAVLVMVLGGAWMTLQLAEERDLARESAERAEAALAGAEAELARAQSLQEFLIGLFRAARPDRPHDELPTTGELLDAGARRALDDGAVSDADRLGMLLAIADVYMNLGQLEQAEPLVESAVALARANAEARPEDLARALTLNGMLVLYPGRAGAAEAMALLIEAEQVAADHERAQGAWLNARIRRAWLQYRLGEASAAHELLDPVMAQSENDGAIRLPDSSRLRLVNTLAGIHGRLGRLEEALEYDRQAVELSARVHGTKSRAHAVERANLAALQIRLGHFDQARDNLDLALELYDRIYQERPVSYRAASLGSLAALNLYTGNYSQALELTHASLREWADAREVDQETYHWRDYHLGRMLLRMRRDEQAVEHLQRSAERFSDPDSPVTGAVLSRARLALARCRLGDAAAGLSALEAMAEWNLPEGPDDQAEIDEARAACLHARGRHTDALASIEASLAFNDPPGESLMRAQRLRLKADILDSLTQPEAAARSREHATAVLLEAGLSQHPEL